MSENLKQYSFKTTPGDNQEEAQEKRAHILRDLLLILGQPILEPKARQRVKQSISVLKTKMSLSK